jgi:hypothetical protein
MAAIKAGLHPLPISASGRPKDPALLLRKKQQLNDRRGRLLGVKGTTQSAAVQWILAYGAWTDALTVKPGPSPIPSNWT